MSSIATAEWPSRPVGPRPDVRIPFQLHVAAPEETADEEPDPDALAEELLPESGPPTALKRASAEPAGGAVGAAASQSPPTVFKPPEATDGPSRSVCSRSERGRAVAVGRGAERAESALHFDPSERSPRSSRRSASRLRWPRGDDETRPNRPSQSSLMEHQLAVGGQDFALLYYFYRFMRK
jgi:hypothetical protein